MNMPKITILYGVLLILLGLAGYFLSDRESLTALIPSAFGILLLAAGLIALKDGARKHAMHAAALLALLGFFGSMGGLKGGASLLFGGESQKPMADGSKSVMALLSLIYFALCVTSFIKARLAQRAQR